MAYLDSLDVTHLQVGFGNLGMRGSLGYEGQSVVVRRQQYTHAFGTHAPARVRFQLDGRFAGFRCPVALNDDVPLGRITRGNL